MRVNLVDMHLLQTRKEEFKATVLEAAIIVIREERINKCDVE